MDGGVYAQQSPVFKGMNQLELYDSSRFAYGFEANASEDLCFYLDSGYEFEGTLPYALGAFFLK